MFPYDLHNHDSSLGCHYVKSRVDVYWCPNLQTCECAALTEPGTSCKDLENVDLSFSYTIPVCLFRNGCLCLEVDGLEVSGNDTFFLESDVDPPCSFCKDSCSSGNKRSIPGFPRDGLILADLCHVDFDEPGSKVKSNHCSFHRNNFSS